MKQTYRIVPSLNFNKNQHKKSGDGHCFMPVMPNFQNMYLFKKCPNMQEFLKNTVLFILILVLVIELFKIPDLS